MNTLQTAFWSGMMATGSMSLSLFRSFDKLPPGEKSPLPPATLTAQSLIPGKFQKPLSSPRQADLTLLSHFAYGIAGALLYSSVAKHVKGPAAVKGGLFGLGVWTVSYLGWIPAFGFRSAAPNMTRSRNTMMIVAHLIWGVSLGMSEKRLRREGETMLDGRRRSLWGE